MLDLGYEDLKNDESIQSDDNLKNLIKQIDEIKDVTSNDDDKIEWVFTEISEWQLEIAFNQWLLDSLNKQEVWTLEILFSELKNIIENQNLNLSEDVKQSVDNLLNIFSQLLNEKQNLWNTIPESEVANEVTWESKEIEASEESWDLTPEQLENIRIIRDEIWIDVSDENIVLIKDKKLTPEQIGNLKNIKKQTDDIWVKISVWDIDNIKDKKEIKLTQKQINEIQKIKSEIWIDISVWDLIFLEDLRLTDEQIENIKRIKNELWYEIHAWDIDMIKDINLTSEQIDNIKNFKNELWIDVSPLEIDELKYVKLTKEEIDNIKKLREQLDSIGISISARTIDNLKNMHLTQEQIENINKLKNEIWIDISSWDIEVVKDVILTDDQIKIIRELKDEIWISISAKDIEVISTLTSKQIENLRKLRDALWSDFIIYGWDIKEIKDLVLTDEQVENINVLRNVLWIDVYWWNILTNKDIKLSQEQIDNIKFLKSELWIDVYASDIKSIKDMKLTSEQIKNIKILKDELWIWVDYENIKYIKDINLSNEDINKLKEMKDLWINLNICDIEPILNNPDILSVNSENFYEWYGYTEYEIESHYHYKKWRIIENIQSYIQNFISENRDIWKAEVIENIRSDLITLPIDERVKILWWINRIVEKFNTVRKYLNFEIYKTPKELLCAMQWITDQNIIEKISDDITVKQYWTWLTFFVWDESSYQIIYDKSLIDSGVKSGWFNTDQSEIKELEWTLSVVNAKDSPNSYKYMRHEGQHNRNIYFMWDSEITPITNVKDEITAYLRDWRACRYIESTLTKSKDEWWLYHYDLDWGARENHKKQVRELIWYANYLVDLTKNPDTWLTKDRVISMLSDTPATERKNLQSNVKKAIKRSTTENDGNNLDSKEFRRAWTAEKQTEINEIMLANSLKEIKHILNDPRYSHISRLPNNKWWIEISAMIDEVAVWKLDITFIPNEIRSQVKKFIR